MLPGRAHGISPAIDGSSSCRSYFHDGLQPIAEGTATNDRTTYTLAPSAIGGIMCRECGIGILPMNTAGTPVPQRYHYDRLCNVVGVTDASGNVVSLYTMEAFGTVLEMTNGGDFANERSTDIQPYHLTTKEYDDDSALYYFNARWYDRETGRFVSCAPIPTHAEHPYAYAEGNRMLFMDPAGQYVRKCPPRDPFKIRAGIPPDKTGWCYDAFTPFHPGLRCYRQVDLCYNPTSPSGNQCCYRQDGSLGQVSPDRWNPAVGVKPNGDCIFNLGGIAAHGVVDVVPYLTEQACDYVIGNLPSRRHLCEWLCGRLPCKR